MQSILEKISSGVYTLSPRRKGKSFIWNVICEILKEDGSLVVDFVYCRSCRVVLKCVGNQTSNLSRHKCCLELKNPSSLKPVNAMDKMEALNTVSRWIVEDCRPFSSASGSGFKAMVKFFIKIGATYGEFVDVDDMLPDGTTVARKCQEEANDKRSELSNQLKDVVSRGGASLTLDLWTDNYVKRSFLGVTMHFEKDFEITNMILGLKSIDCQKATSAKVLEKLNSLLNQFGINSMDNIKFITDRGTNIVKALQNNIRLNCSSELFANVLDKSLDETQELVDLLIACQQIFRYLKKANLQHMLNTSFENPCMTRWNSNYTMYKSISDNWLDIKSILNDNKENNRLLNIDITTLNSLVELSKNFERIFKELQTFNSATLCFVLPSIYKVKSLCEFNSADTSAISIFKKRVFINICDIWENKLSIWHKVALFLYPPALNMQLKDRNEIKDFCVSQMEKYYNVDTTTNPTESSNNFDLTPASPSSDISSCSTTNDSDSPKLKNIFFFLNLIQTSLNAKESPLQEVEKYCQEMVPITEEFEVVEWWKNNMTYYPQLSKFALTIHSIPASSAAAEMSFSLVSNIITEKRNKLAPNSVDDLLFLHSFYKNKNVIK